MILTAPPPLGAGFAPNKGGGREKGHNEARRLFDSPARIKDIQSREKGAAGLVENDDDHEVISRAG